MYDDDFSKYFKLMYDAKENDDFKNAKIFKIYEDLSNTEMSWWFVVVTLIVKSN